MADLSSFTHKWRAIPNTQNDANKVSKRNRQPVSCQSCQRRKLKCDRGHPCEACSKRGDEESCNYGKVAMSTNSQQTAASSKATSSARAQDRLRQLEDLVRQMIEPPHQAPTPPAPVINPDENIDAGQTSLSRDRHATNYKGSTHWSAILDQIHDLRTLLTDSTSSPNDQESNKLSSHSNPESPSGYGVETSHSTSQLLAAPEPPLLDEILRDNLPPRRQIDRLLSIYFNAKYSILPFIHTQQFAQQYESFWADSTRKHTSPMWLSMLFSIICLANNIRVESEPDNLQGSIDRHKQSSRDSSQHVSPDSMADSTATPENAVSTSHQLQLMSERFLTASAQLLIIGDYTKPQPHLIEALFLHIQGKYTISLDPNKETALIFSLMVRQAYTMSYHRDCTNYPPDQFTVFEAEMRRRLWAAVKAFDNMISFQLGIPNNVAANSWDTKLPRNLEDADFNEQTKTLPESRPDTEPTHMLYFTTKARIMDTYGRILRHTLSFDLTSPSVVREVTDRAEVMKLDEEVRRELAGIPNVMKVKPMSLSFSDPGWLIMLRTNIMFVLQKCLCVLHRKYLVSDSTDAAEDSSYSRKTVVEAAKLMVTHFFELHNEFQPGGQLARDKWMLGSFLMDDFLLAAMLLCLAFWNERKSNLKRTRDAGTVARWLERDQEARTMLALLEKSKEICHMYSKKSGESTRVAEVLGTVLNKVQTETNRSRLPQSSDWPTAWNVTDNSQPRRESDQRRLYEATRDRLDISPLTINENNTLSRITNSSQHASTTSVSHSEETPPHEHAPATWDIFHAVPYKSQPPSQRRSSSNKPDLQAPPLTFGMSSTTFDPSPSNPTDQQVTQRTSDLTSAAMISPHQRQPNQQQDHQTDIFSDNPNTNAESILLDSTDTTMDWASFDHFLNNFTPNFSSSIGLSPTPNPLHPYNPFGQILFPGSNIFDQDRDQDDESSFVNMNGPAPGVETDLNGNTEVPMTIHPASMDIDHGQYVDDNTNATVDGTRNGRINGTAGPWHIDRNMA